MAVVLQLLQPLRSPAQVASHATCSCSRCEARPPPAPSRQPAGRGRADEGRSVYLPLWWVTKTALPPACPPEPCTHLRNLTDHYGIDVVGVAIHHAVVGRNDLRDRAHPLPQASRGRRRGCCRVVGSSCRDATGALLGLTCWCGRCSLLVVLLVGRGTSGWCAAGGGSGGGGGSSGTPRLLLLPRQHPCSCSVLRLGAPGLLLLLLLLLRGAGLCGLLLGAAPPQG